jgi:hypothetical protein
VTFADLCPSIRCNAWTLTPADTANDAQVCRNSCGVILCTLALATAAANHPPDDFGRAYSMVHTQLDCVLSCQESPPQKLNIAHAQCDSFAPSKPAVGQRQHKGLVFSGFAGKPVHVIR